MREEVCRQRRGVPMSEEILRITEPDHIDKEVYLRIKTHMERFLQKILHGDLEHQTWLRNEFSTFLDELKPREEKTDG